MKNERIKAGSFVVLYTEPFEEGEDTLSTMDDGPNAAAIVEGSAAAAIRKGRKALHQNDAARDLVLVRIERIIPARGTRKEG